MLSDTEQSVIEVIEVRKSSHELKRCSYSSSGQNVEVCMEDFRSNWKRWKVHKIVKQSPQSLSENLIRNISFQVHWDFNFATVFCDLRSDVRIPWK